jgi:hypothetical protein
MGHETVQNRTVARPKRLGIATFCLRRAALEETRGDGDRGRRGADDYPGVPPFDSASIAAAKPAGIAVETPTKFDLVMSRIKGKALGMGRRPVRVSRATL